MLTFVTLYPKIYNKAYYYAYSRHIALQNA